MLDKLTARLKEYEIEIEKSAARHNSMLGAYQELKHVYELAKETEPVIEIVDVTPTP